MAWKLLDKPKTVKVTKNLAKTYSEMDSAPNDRPLSERRLMVYRKMVAEGGFRPVSWASAICKETGGLYRVNGKHTSTMLAAMNPIPEFYAVIEDYECDTLEDVAKLYATFDSGQQSRTARDIYMSFAAVIPELKTLPMTIISVCVSGMAMHLTGGRQKTEDTPAERAERLLDYPEFVMWTAGILSSGEDANLRGADGRRTSKHIFRQPVVAAMMGSYEKAKAQATEFWSLVRDESGPSNKTPDRTLAKYLNSVGINSGSGANRIKKVDAREVYVKSIHAFHAWHKDETTNLNYHPDKDVPAFK